MIMTAALAALALAGGGGDHDASGVCPVRHLDGVRGGTVTAGVNIDDARSTAARKARCGVVRRVVRTLVDEGIQKPVRVRGYRCTPTVTGRAGRRVAWTCTYRGGHPQTTVELSFAYRLTAPH